MNTFHTAIITLCRYVLLCITLTAFFPLSAYAEEKTVEKQVKQKSHRIITLAPGATELLYSIGLGDLIVATVEHSDYPPATLEIPRIGNGFTINIESVLAYQPDWVVVWKGGTSTRLIEQLDRLNIPTLEYKTSSFDDIFSFIERASVTFNKDTEKLLKEYKRRVYTLKEANKGKSEVKVFFQLWSSPLLTANNRQLISQMIELCGGQNLFADHHLIAPEVSLESVLALNPDVILAPVSNTEKDPLTVWTKWVDVTAVKKQNLFLVEGDLISRASLRSIDGAEEICRVLDSARKQLSL